MSPITALINRFFNTKSLKLLLRYYFQPYLITTFLKIGSSETDANKSMQERSLSLPKLLKILFSGLSLSNKTWAAAINRSLRTGCSIIGCLQTGFFKQFTFGSRFSIFIHLQKAAWECPTPFERFDASFYQEHIQPRSVKSEDDAVGRVSKPLFTPSSV